MTKQIEKQTPADKVIAAYGGVRATARAVKRAPSQVSRWRLERAKGGLGGRVPAGVMPTIVEHIKAGGVALAVEDLIEEVAV